MKGIDLIGQLQAHGCVLIREGGIYSAQADCTSMVLCHRPVSDHVASL